MKPRVALLKKSIIVACKCGIKSVCPEIRFREEKQFSLFFFCRREAVYEKDAVRN